MRQLNVKKELDKINHELMRRDIIVGNEDHKYVLSYDKYYREKMYKQFYEIKIRKLKAGINEGDITRVQHMCKKKGISQIEGIISSITEKTLTEEDVKILRYISDIGIVGEIPEEKQRECLVLVQKKQDGNVVAENSYGGFKDVQSFAIKFDRNFLSAYKVYIRKNHIGEEIKKDEIEEER